MIPLLREKMDTKVWFAYEAEALSDGETVVDAGPQTVRIKEASELRQLILSAGLTVLLHGLDSIDLEEAARSTGAPLVQFIHAYQGMCIKRIKETCVSYSDALLSTTWSRMSSLLST